jgi:hypothetical protein
MDSCLKEPFLTAFNGKGSIDYRLVPGAAKTDHTVVKELGYKPEMHSDCSYSAKGLPSFSLSSYGDWGTFYSSRASDFEKKLFLTMCDNGIIKPWRVRDFIDSGNGGVVMCDYSADTGKWKKYDSMARKWVETESPYGER